MTAATPRMPVNDRISAFISTITSAASALSAFMNGGNPSVARRCRKIQILCKHQPGYGRIRADSENLSRKLHHGERGEQCASSPMRGSTEEPLPRSAGWPECPPRTQREGKTRCSPCLTAAAFGEIMLLDGLQPGPKSYKLCLFD